MFPQDSQGPQIDPILSVDPIVLASNSYSFSLAGKGLKVWRGIAVNACVNNTLRHSRLDGRAADDLDQTCFAGSRI
jgi:hypothetical protein